MAPTRRQRRPQVKLTKRLRRSARLEEKRQAAWLEGQQVMGAGTKSPKREPSKHKTPGKHARKKQFRRHLKELQAAVGKQIEAARVPARDTMLFKLPAELRNEIYEMVLLERGPICIQKWLRVPGLLQVSSEVRQETVKMWYGENEFSHVIRNCSARYMIAWEKNRRSQGMKTKDVALTMRNVPHWGKLMGWCRAICFDGIKGACKAGCAAACGEDCFAARREDPDTSNLDPTEIVIRSATDIACRCFRNSSWEECKAQLDDLRSQVSDYDRRWLHK
ncbi:hypothetical protein LTR17_003024 [Elasticomyces elasticus]|nr:hypothetical protein LTR17_003024 [Elasticomyces elasticus]